MKSINITKEGILEYYGNRVGYIRNNTAYVDEMFQKADIQEFLTNESGIPVEWQKDIFDKLIRGELDNTNQLTLKNCRLYQLKNTTNVEMRYIKYNELKAKGFGEPNISDYKVVYDGNVGTNNLEEIYDRFDRGEMSGDFKEGGIYISDVIELYDEKSSAFYYINPTGFEKLEHFNEPKIEAVKTFGEPAGKEPDGRQNKAFETVKTAEMPKEMPKQKAPAPGPVDEPDNTEIPSVKEEFQVETFKITM